MRTFVFISDIPEFLLQPIYRNDGGDGSGGDVKAKKSLALSKFDLRYERLRRLLVEHSSGVMLVMHLETKGYALALYASEGEALAACKADITPEQPGNKFRPLRLRILEKEKPRPPEAVFNPYLTVEGEEVRKVELADTRGLELVYRGRALAKWCPHTLAGEDCYFGVSCLKLHRSAVQRTVRKRPRIDEEDAEVYLSREQQLTVQQLLHSMKDARAALAPAALQMKNCLYVSVSQAEMEQICGVGSSPLITTTATGTSSNNSDSLHSETAYQAVLRRVEAAMSSSASSSTSASNCVSYFPRLSCSGGAPWDWTVESAEGRGLLRRDCPLPANGAPTPLERDLYIQHLWYHMNQRNRCTTAQEVLRMLQGSRRVRDAVRRRAAGLLSATTLLTGAHPCTENSAVPQPPLTSAADAHRSDGNKASDDLLFICLEPWLYLPTVGCEVTVFLERGGRRVRGVVQRYGQLRLMTSAALLATATSSGIESNSNNTDAMGSVDNARAPLAESAAQELEDTTDVDTLLARYAVLESGNDDIAEMALAQELRTFQRCFAVAVDDLSRHLQKHPAATGGANAAWCVHLAVVLPPSSLVTSTETASSATTTTAATMPSVVLLSCSPYHRALEECSLYHALAPPMSPVSASEDEREDLRQPGKVEVTWNTQRHPYIPLFSRDVLEKLRTDATDSTCM